MREVGVLEAKTHFSTLLNEVERGGAIVITRHGHPIARLAPMEGEPSRRRLSGEELVTLFDGLREEIRERWLDEPDFDWKAAVEEGRS